MQPITGSCSPTPLPRSWLNCLSERHSRRHTPEAQSAALQIDPGPTLGVLERLQIADVAPHADVVVEESHDARAEVVERRRIGSREIEHIAAFDVRPDDSDAAGDEWPHARAMRAAERNAKNEIAHSGERVIASE